MTAKFYRYSLAIQIAKVHGWLGLGMIVTLFVVLFGAVGLGYTGFSGKFLLVMATLVFGIVMNLSFIHSFSDIGVSDNGILVQFLWQYILVRWDEIVDVHEHRGLFFVLYIVRTTRLTFFHKLYGLLYTLSASPALVISEKIRGCDELISEIRRHTIKKY